MRLAAAVGGWLGVFLVYRELFRAFQPPGWPGTAAVALLVLAFAATVHLNHGLLVPRLWPGPRYWLALAGVVLVLTVAVVFSIQAAYDAFGVPRAGRLSPAENLASDAAGIGVHVAAAAGARRMAWRDRGPGAVL